MFQVEGKARAMALSLVCSSDRKNIDTPGAQLTNQRVGQDGSRETDWGESLINPGQ